MSRCKTYYGTDFNNAWLKARGDQALSAYKEYVTEQTHVVDEQYRAVGAVVSASEALVASGYWIDVIRRPTKRQSK